MEDGGTVYTPMTIEYHNWNNGLGNSLIIAAQRETVPRRGDAVDLGRATPPVILPGFESTVDLSPVLPRVMDVIHLPDRSAQVLLL